MLYLFVSRSRTVCCGRKMLTVMRVQRKASFISLSWAARTRPNVIVVQGSWELQMNPIVGIGYLEFEFCSLDPNLKIIEIQRTTYEDCHILFFLLQKCCFMMSLIPRQHAS